MNFLISLSFCCTVFAGTKKKRPIALFFFNYSKLQSLRGTRINYRLVYFCGQGFWDIYFMSIIRTFVRNRRKDKVEVRQLIKFEVWESAVSELLWVFQKYLLLNYYYYYLIVVVRMSTTVTSTLLFFTHFYSL